jgi:predicted nuclease with TOPRIM domain
MALGNYVGIAGARRGNQIMSDILKLTEERDRARGEVMNLKAKVDELEHICDECMWNPSRTLRLQEEWEKTHPPSETS